MSRIKRSKVTSQNVKRSRTKRYHSLFSHQYQGRGHRPPESLQALACRGSEIMNSGSCLLCSADQARYLEYNTLSQATGTGHPIGTDNWGQRQIMKEKRLFPSTNQMYEYISSSSINTISQKGKPRTCCLQANKVHEVWGCWIMIQINK